MVVIRTSTGTAQEVATEEGPMLTAAGSLQYGVPDEEVVGATPIPGADTYFYQSPGGGMQEVTPSAGIPAWLRAINPDALGGHDYVNDISFAWSENFSRASAAWADDTAKLWGQFLTDVKRRNNAGILIEPAATNLATNPQDFTQSFWQKTGSTVSGNTLTAPDGASTADTVVESAASSEHRIATSNVAITGGVTYTWSIFAKRKDFDIVQIQMNDAFQAYWAYFNLATGVIGSKLSGLSASIVDAGNGWYRLSVTRSLNVGATIVSARLVLARTGDLGTAGVSYAGDGTSGVYVWQAQLEAGGRATSIVTSGTRAADDLDFTQFPGGRLVFTFDDNSTQEVAATEPYQVPTNLNRPRVKTVVSLPP